MKTAIKLLAGIIIICGTCFAHQDRIITVKETGELEGLPAEYTPAVLNAAFGNNQGSAPIQSLALRLGKNEVHIPLCAAGLLDTQKMSDITAAASWYHNEKTLPYYLTLNFFDAGYDKSRRANPGFSLLFNLRTAKLLRMEAIIVRKNGAKIQHVPVDLSARCKSEELISFADSNR